MSRCCHILVESSPLVLARRTRVTNVAGGESARFRQPCATLQSLTNLSDCELLDAERTFLFAGVVVVVPVPRTGEVKVNGGGQDCPPYIPLSRPIESPVRDPQEAQKVCSRIALRSCKLVLASYSGRSARAGSSVLWRRLDGK